MNPPAYVDPPDVMEGCSMSESQKKQRRTLALGFPHVWKRARASRVYCCGARTLIATGVGYCSRREAANGEGGRSRRGFLPPAETFFGGKDASN